jgi:hypothetical protein
MIVFIDNGADALKLLLLWLILCCALIVLTDADADLLL